MRVSLLIGAYLNCPLLLASAAPLKAKSLALQRERYESAVSFNPCSPEKIQARPFELDSLHLAALFRSLSVDSILSESNYVLVAIS